MHLGFDTSARTGGDIPVGTLPQGALLAFVRRFKPCQMLVPTGDDGV
jgi:hypothetical protein